MRKRIGLIGLMLVLFLILGNTSSVQAAQAGTCGENASWTYDEVTQTLTVEGTGAMSNYNFENVPWLSFRESVENVVVGEGITKIGEYSFYYFKNLKNVSLPDTLTEIGKRGFSVTGISQIELPDDVQTLGDYSFAMCENLTVFKCSDDLDIPEYTLVFDGTPYYSTKKYIGNDWRFDGIDRMLIKGSGEIKPNVVGSPDLKEKVKTIVLKGKFTSVGNSAFSDFTSLENVELPDTVVSIGMNAFMNTAIKSFVLPKALETIERDAFSGSKLTSLILPETLKEVDGSVIKDCAELEEFTVLCPISGTLNLNGCTSLKTLVLDCGPLTYSDYFANNTTLENVTLGSKMTSLGIRAFNNCTSLKMVTIENGLTAIGQLMFQNCESLTEINIPSSVTSIDYKAFDGCTSLNKVTFNDGLMTIGEWAFNACPALEEVSIPKTVTKIGQYAFHGELKWYADNPGEKEYDHYYAYDTPFIMEGYTNSVAYDYAMEPKYKITFKSLGELSCDDLGHQPDKSVKENVKEATCTEAGKYDEVVYCSSCKEELSRKSVKVSAKGHSYSSSYTVDKKATATANGSKSKHCTRSGCSGKSSVKTIYKASGVKLSTVSYTYNGKAKNPTVYIKDSNGKTISSSNYTLTKPSGRKNVGEYTYTIKFKNEYSGTKKLVLKINPKGTSVSSLTKAKKAFTVKWKKQSGKMATSRISGYQIQYSTSKKFTKAKTVTVSGYSKTSKKITKLTAKKTYYVRIRTYKTISGTKYYSGWSNYKSVKTK